MSHFVYVMVAHIDRSAFFKIGMSRAVGFRLGGVQTGCPVEIAQVIYIDVGEHRKAREVEAGFHDLLQPFHSFGEWFKFDLNDKRHKKAFSLASDLLLTKAVGRSWKWRVIERDGVRDLVREDGERAMRAAAKRQKERVREAQDEQDRLRASKGLSPRFFGRVTDVT